MRHRRGHSERVRRVRAAAQRAGYQARRIAGQRTGLIDSNYRGEIQAILVNLDPQSEFAIKRGDRIAQLVVMRVPDAAFDVCAELPDTERGAGGFGSSGVSLEPDPSTHLELL